MALTVKELTPAAIVLVIGLLFVSLPYFNNEQLPLISSLGLYAFLTVLLAVSVSPLHKHFKSGVTQRLLLGRRYVGVVAFLFAAAHVYLVYSQLLGWDINKVVESVFLLAGATAFTILFAMALTSNDFAVKKLGAKNWKRLHKLVYLVVALLAFHALSIGQVFLSQAALKASVLILVLLVFGFKALEQGK